MIVMDGTDADHMPLPFTLALGSHWELWQAYRELYCNALDEGGGVCDKHADAHPIEGHTLVIVKGDAFAEIHSARQRFINDEPPVCQLDGLDIVPTAGAYLKGIRISPSIYYPPVFGYNFKRNVPLTEDRTLGCNATAENRIRDALLSCTDVDLIERILLAPEGSFEHQIAWNLCSVSDVGETFRNVLLSLSRNRGTKLPPHARELARKLDEKKAAAETLHLSDVERTAYRQAVEFLARHGVEVEEFPVEFVVTLGDGVMGSAAAGTIFVSQLAFQYGVKALVATLYEEHMHLARGWRDGSREMQNHLFHTVIGLWEEMDGVAL